MKKNRFDNDKEPEVQDLLTRKKLGVKETISIAICFIILPISLIGLCSIFIMDVGSYDLVETAHRISDDKDPNQPEATPNVKPVKEPDAYSELVRSANHIVRRHSGSGENDGDTVTIQVLLPSGCSVEEYTRSGAHWLITSTKEFDSEEEAENYLAGQIPKKKPIPDKPVPKKKLAPEPVPDPSSDN